MIPVGVAVHVGDVVVEQEAGEAGIAQEQDDLGWVVVAVADEALDEVGHDALHVAEMDIVDLALRPEELDHLAHIGLAAGHLGTAAEAEIEPPAWAVRIELIGALEPGRLAEDAS